LGDRPGAAGSPMWGSSYGPTQTAKDGLAIANKLMTDYEQRIAELQTKLDAIYAALRKAGSPVIMEME